MTPPFILCDWFELKIVSSAAFAGHRYLTNRFAFYSLRGTVADWAQRDEFGPLR
jgi:hypothetical protein